MQVALEYTIMPCLNDASKNDIFELLLLSNQREFLMQWIVQMNRTYYFTDESYVLLYTKQWYLIYVRIHLSKTVDEITVHT